MIIAASNSSEMFVLGRIEDSWRALSINEEFQPILPLSKFDDEDTGPIGISLDCSIALAEDLEIKKLNLANPIFFFLNTDGVLSFYDVNSTRRTEKFVNLCQIRPFPESLQSQKSFPSTFTNLMMSKNNSNLNPAALDIKGATTASRSPALTHFPNEPSFSSKISSSQALGFGFATTDFEKKATPMTAIPLERNTNFTFIKEKEKNSDGKGASILGHESLKPFEFSQMTKTPVIQPSFKFDSQIELGLEKKALGSSDIIPSNSKIIYYARRYRLILSGLNYMLNPMI